VKLPAPKKGRVSAETRRHAQRDSEKGRQGLGRPPAKRSRADTAALRREGHRAASAGAISRQARQSARARTARDRSSSARKAARTRAQEK
jgi:hypothetical protein